MIRRGHTLRLGLALCWLAVFLIALAYLGLRTAHGLGFRTDLMALVPQEDSNPALADARNAAIRHLSRRVVFLVGDKDPEMSRQAAAKLSHRLAGSGQLQITTGGTDSQKLKQIGAAYFPYRAGLLSEQDRAQLLAGHGKALQQRVLAQAFGIGGMTSAALLRTDPFLLLPAFLSALPSPHAKLTLQQGQLGTEDGGKYWVLISGMMRNAPYALNAQKRFTALTDRAIRDVEHGHPQMQVLKSGAVFYAKAGAETAMSETSAIGILSILLTIVLLIAAFRSARPLLLSLAVIAVGLLAAASFSLWLWGEIHVLALLFGVSLIGISVDYCLEYFCEAYASEADSFTRIRKILPGITLGVLTTAAGYLLLLIAPFPGLRQIAVFSVAGLAAAWLSVVLWLPFLDRTGTPRHAMPFTRPLGALRHFWQGPTQRTGRNALLVLMTLAAIAGAWRFHADDDVHNMQALSPTLLAEQRAIQQHVGMQEENRFFLIYGRNTEAVLQKEEALADRLAPLMQTGKLGSYQSMASFIPSRKRQAENRKLAEERLYRPYLKELSDTLGMNTLPTLPGKAPLMTPADLPQGMGFLSILQAEARPGHIVHIVTLQGVKAPALLEKAAQGLAGVQFVDPGRDYSRLFAKYRLRALVLLIASIMVMFLILLPRYGLRPSLKIMQAPVMAVLYTPFLCALGGATFTFFDVIALVLILSMAMDYAVFFAESHGPRRASAHFAVSLSACTTIISFGFLAFSSVHAVQTFGLTMLVGIFLAYLLTPLGDTYKA